MFTNSFIYNSNLIKVSENKTFSKENSFHVMKRAAKSCSDYIINNIKPKSTLIITGPGNNGGDWLLIAKNLIKNHFKVSIFSPLGFPKSRNAKKAILDLNSKEIFINSLKLKKYDLLVDALFGFNFNRKFEKNIVSIIKKINSSKIFKISIDVPSGIYCDSGHYDEVALKSDVTLTFHRIKPCHVILPGKDYSGKLEIIDINLSNLDHECKLQLITPPVFYPPSVYSHKYNRGELIVFAGEEMVGASKLAVLSASQTAFRAGTGIVKLLVSKKEKQYFKKHILEEILLTYNNTNEAMKIIKEKRASVVFGCGLSVNLKNERLLENLLKTECNLVIDASAFSLMGKNKKLFLKLLKDRKGSSVLTPHLKEFKQIFNLSGNKILDTVLASKASNSVVFLKGNDTIIASPDERVFFNYFASSYLATAGSGDVLAGIIGALFAQNYSSILASTVGCFLHSKSAVDLNKPFASSELILQISETIKTYTHNNVTH